MKIKIIVTTLLSLVLLIAKAQKTDSIVSISQNPFPISTNITILNLNNDTVSFKIYNRWGSLINTYFENIVCTGNIVLNFDASLLPDGIYLALLNKNSERHGFKLIKDSSSTINENTQTTNNLKIFPNPITNKFSISTNKKVEKIEIYNVNGKQILSFNNPNSNDFDIENFENGVYIILITIDNITYIRKILKE
jgi:hypothetical protein